MKSLFLAAMLALCSCAVGTIDELPEENEDVHVTPAQKPAPTPEPADEGTTAPQCKIDAYWVGNCYVVKIYCKDQPTRVEVACGPPRPLWPWERDPYPPPYDNGRE
jgi:hypothetical protein